MVIINDTLQFILPMLYTAKFNNAFFIRPNFVGAFTGDVEYPEMDDKILLVYKDISLNTDFEEMERELKTLPTFYASYTYEMEDVRVLVFDIPLNFEEDYALYLMGSFGMLSPELTLNIVKFWDLNKEDKLFQILVGILEYEGEPIDKQILMIDEHDRSIDFIDRLLEKRAKEELELLR